MSTFPNNAKGAVMTPLDKGSLNKNDVSIFRLASVLNCFSKIFENVMKGQMMPFIENYLFSYLPIDHLIQWNLSKVDTYGTEVFVRFSEN